MPLADFNKQFLEDIVVEEAAPQLATHQDASPKNETVEFIRVDAARFDLGRMEVFFQCSVRGPDP